MNTYLKYQPPVMQFFAFLGLAGGFFFIGTVVTMFFFKDIGYVLTDTAAPISAEMTGRFRLGQLISTTITFVIPALLFGYYSSPKALPYVGVRKSVSPVLLVAAIVLLFAVQPFIGWLGDVNAHFNFGSLQTTIERLEARYDAAMKVFLRMKTPNDLMVNLLLMALLPAIGEELFFRGALQKVLYRLSGKPWLAIIISATVFALLHGTLLKVLPIFTLGLMLGAVYHITNNLWYNAAIHFLNNAFAVLAIYYAGSNPFLKRLASDEWHMPLYGAVVSLIISIGIIYFFSRQYQKIAPSFIEAEEEEKYI